MLCAIQAGNVHGKEQPMCMRGSAGGVGLGRRGVAISCSTKKDARVYNMQVGWGLKAAVLGQRMLSLFGWALALKHLATRSTSPTAIPVP